MSRTVLPSSRVGWWTVGLAWTVLVVGLLLPAMTSWFGPLQERLGRRGLPTGSSLVSAEIVLAAVAITLGVVALLRKDRAWLLIGSFAVAVLVGGFWMLFVLGEVISPH